MKYQKVDNILFFGAGEALAKIAAELLRKGTPVRVVTSLRQLEDRLLDASQTFGEFLVKQQIPHHVSNDANTDPVIRDWITPTTAGISLGAPWIFENSFIERFQGLLFNSHASRLPKGRGGGFLSWNILRDERLSSCLVHQMSTGIDTGQIVSFREFHYPPECRIPKDYFLYYTKQNYAFLMDFITKLKEEAEFTPFGQPEYLSSYWPRLSTEHHGFIDWQWDAVSLERFIRAFDDPFAGATTFLGEKKVHLKQCFLDGSEGGFHPFQSGLVFRKRPEYVSIATRTGTLCVGSVCDSEGRNIWEQIKPGMRFFTPSKHLEEALSYRAHYTPAGLKQT